MTKVQKRLLSYVILFLGLLLVRVIGPVGLIPAFALIAIFYFLSEKVDPSVNDVTNKKRESTSELVGEATGKTIAKSIKATKKGLDRVKNISLATPQHESNVAQTVSISNEVDEAYAIVDGIMRPNKLYEIYSIDTSNDKMVLFTLSTSDLNILKSKLSYGEYSKVIKQGRSFIFS
ncbi:MAG: hypothetical protein WDZ35_07925 [Crocinitomicaceae bacterium]